MGLERSLGGLLPTRSPGHVPRVASGSCAPADASRAMRHSLEEEAGVGAAVSPNVTPHVPAPFPQTLTCTLASLGYVLELDQNVLFKTQVIILT